MNGTSSATFSWLVGAATVIAFLTNVIVKYWQRWLKHAGGDEYKEASSWSFAAACLRQMVAVGDPSDAKTDARDLNKVRNVSIKAYLGDHVSRFVTQVERWIIFHDRTNPDDGKSVVGFLKLQGSCALFASLEVSLCLIAKVGLYIYALIRMVLSAELRSFERSRKKKWTNPPAARGDTRVRIIFVRHGESMWNRAFNMGVSFRSILRTSSMLLWEFCLLGDLDSVILDAPLSSVGVTQAAELQAWLGVEAISVNKQGDGHSSATRLLNTIKTAHARGSLSFVASNLRRAISTMAIGFGDLMNPANQAVVNSSLQEVTRNPDSVCLTAKYSASFPSTFETEAVPWNLVDFYASSIDWRLNDGNRGLRTKLESRLEAFVCAIDELAATKQVDTFVVCGHSLWLKQFLRYFVEPEASQEVRAQKRKISNCGIISFDLHKRIGETKPFFLVDPASIELCRGCYL